MSTARRGGVNNIILISGGGSDPGVYAGTANPSSGAGFAAAEGSIYFQYGSGAGRVWMKLGSADTDWYESGSPFMGYFGDASEGDVTLVANDSANEHWYGDLDTAGYDVNIGRLFCRGTLTVRSGSNIYFDGDDASGSSGGSAIISNITGGGGGGGDGQVAVGDDGADQTSTSYGGDGGDGGAGTGGAGGGGGSAVGDATETSPHQLPEVVTARATGRFTGPGYAKFIGGAGGGGGGGNGAAAAGGGGGAGGCVMVIAARHIVVEAGGSIHCNGGDGADGTAADCGGGGGGGGGALLMCYETLTNNGTIESAGGAGGASGGGGGSAGSAGSAGNVFQLPLK